MPLQSTPNLLFKLKDENTIRTANNRKCYTIHIHKDSYSEYQQRKDQVAQPESSKATVGCT